MDTVLIIEDDAEISNILNLYLQRHDFRVFTTGGWEAIEILTREQIDLVLLDIMLPGENGFELCREIRKKTDIPIVFMSAKSEETDKILG